MRVDVRERLSEPEAAAVTGLVEAATQADGVRPLNEEATLRLRHGGGPGARALLLYDGTALAGFAHFEPDDDGASGELVVRPDLRGRGLGRLLLQATLDEAGGPLSLWAHGDHPAAGRLASALGFTRARSLWRMRRPLAEPLPAVRLPAGVRLRAFRPGADDEAWLTLNARAFAHHPEQGGWTTEDLRRRQEEAWFDPAGFFLAVREDPPRPVGFHWTKIHTEEGREPIGEVYVVGVDPGEQGGGLGKALTIAGLTYLRARGLTEVMLYVDEDNTAAVKVYTALGFTRWDTDVKYRRG